MAVENYSFKFDQELMKMFEEFCENVGLDVNAALTIFIKKTISENKIPFELTYNKKLAAFERIDEMLASKASQGHANISEDGSMDELFKIVKDTDSLKKTNIKEIDDVIAKAQMAGMSDDEIMSIPIDVDNDKTVMLKDILDSVNNVPLPQDIIVNANGVTMKLDDNVQSLIGQQTNSEDDSFLKRKSDFEEMRRNAQGQSNFQQFDPFDD